MDTERIEDVERRLAALEADMATARRTLAMLTQEAPAPPPSPTPLKTTGSQQQPQAGASATPPEYITRSKKPSRFKVDAFAQQFGSSEFWINKVGIGLLLLGVIFLFKYSIEQGWITPAIRVLSGMALGVALTIAGVRMYDKTRHQSLVALGGAVATFYICGFAMFQIYELVPYSVAFGLMFFVSLLAFTFSIKQDEPALSFVGALGAFAAPFLLYTGQGSATGLMIYTSLVIITSCAVYVTRGWVSLLTLSAVCGWLIIFITIESYMIGQTDKLAVQAAIALSWLLFWGGPLTRLTLLTSESIPKWLKRDKTDESSPAHIGSSALPGHAHTFTVTSPVIALALSVSIWSFADTTWSLISSGIAGIYFLVWLKLRGAEKLQELATTQMIASFLMLTAGAIALLDDTTTPAFIAAQALALAILAKRNNSKSIKHWALAYLIGSLLWIGIEVILGTLFDSSTLRAYSPETLVALWIASVTFGFAYLSVNREERNGLTGVGALILTLTCLRVNGSDGLFFAVTLTGIAIVIIGQKLRQEALYNIGNAIFVTLAIWLVARLYEFESIGAPLLNLQAGVEGLAVLSGFALSRFITRHRFSVAYGLAAHVAFLALTYREFIQLENGHGIITSIWSAYTIGLIILSLRLRDTRLKQVATATLALIVGKLFLVDLGNLESLWRILLFIGLGGLLMAVSYFYQRIWNSATSSTIPPTTPADEPNEREPSET